MYLLRHVKPERYGGGAPAPQSAPAVEESLRAMEPPLPAPPERLLGPDTLADELEIADIADGALPRFLSEQRPPKTAAQVEAEARAAQDRRGAEALDKFRRGQEELSRQEFVDMCRHLDPAARGERSRRRYR